MIKKICFGVLLIKPENFYSYTLPELWLTLKGWSDQAMFNLSVQRQLAMITGEITNRTMGGSGVVDYIKASFPLPHDKIIAVREGSERLTIAELIERHKKMMDKNRAERERKQKGLNDGRAT